jgi:DNA-binding transcriptional MerR regulator
MVEGELRVGELARRAGLTVRTLHHWDELGLLRPSRRTTSGHRLYGEAEVGRLQQIVSLRALGLSLDETRRWLDAPGASLLEALRLQAARLRRRLASDQTLLARLENLVERLSGNGDVSTEEILDTMEAMTMYEKYYTPEQLEQLRQRGEALGEEGMRAAEEEWRRIFDACARAAEAGDDPVSPEMVAVGRRALELIDAFTGGDPGTRRSLDTLYREQSTAPATQQGFPGDPEVWGYLSRVMEAARRR